MIENNDLVLIIGIRGCGKSTLSRALSSTFHREIIFDRLRERRDGIIITDLNQFSRYWNDHHGDENFQIIIQLRSSRDDELFAFENNEILRIVYETGLRKTEQGLDHQNTLLLFEELQFYCTPHSIIPYLKEAILTGRHSRLTIIGNTQRPANIHGDFKGNAHFVFAGQLVHKADVDYLKGSILGEHATTCFTLQKFHFAFRSHTHPFSIVKV